MGQLPGVITRFASGTYTITRRGAGTYAAGVLVPGATSTVPDVVMSIQPTGGRGLQPAPEGQAGREQMVAFTSTLLYPRAPGAAGDLVTYKSETWECIRCERWEAFGDTFYRAWIERQVNGP